MTLTKDIETTTVVVDGVSYPAELVADGAAYEVFSDAPAPGFMSLLAPDRWPYHRFIPSYATGVETVLHAPVRRGLSWEVIHRLSQAPPRDQATAETIATIRNTVTIRRGTRMVKPLSPGGVAAVLKGQLPHGFCYREWDVAHLRTQSEQSILTGATLGEVTYMLRWRAVDPLDYQIPAAQLIPGLVAMPSHDRVGAPVLGTGFAPSSGELIPEWITADFADLPLTANASIVALAPDGTEVVCYTFQPEGRGWLRLVGPQWRHLLNPVRELSVEQEYIAVGGIPAHSKLVGIFRNEEYQAVADPPSEFRVLAMTRAARYPVETLMRRTRFARWRGALTTILSEEGSWIRLRLCRPDPVNVAALGAQCYERGVYEAWAPANEVADAHDVNINYPM